MNKSLLKARTFALLFLFLVSFTSCYNTWLSVCVCVVYFFFPCFVVLASFDEPKRLVIWCRKSYFLFVLVAEELGSFGSPDIASVLVFYSSLVFPSCRDSSPMSPSICGGGIPCATFYVFGLFVYWAFWFCAMWLNFLHLYLYSSTYFPFHPYNSSRELMSEKIKLDSFFLMPNLPLLMPVLSSSCSCSCQWPYHNVNYLW